MFSSNFHSIQTRPFVAVLGRFQTEIILHRLSLKQFSNKIIALIKSVIVLDIIGETFSIEIHVVADKLSVWRRFIFGNKLHCSNKCLR